ncbi:MAG: lipoprotein-releasing ABC transporter permease subunit [Pseudodesulfovibrio sp.]|uniref:Lipoprotein releasing system, transmembrane protein, LolC/E family n=1 Tax=Pseudodesulfovibrio aespoeensis (strain ATCC 700646 / DSM 10631 / Aspo-2) TaxID=643562 RepID=E6VVW6_PSEA9|nr:MULTISPECIES: lipoprotein-releasing ABC transporter permease subunit [Pseudodesulfovibrio]MBU4244353.1 lipoprotein-releasing ABC transporter permease subunit [Pseudomonadota bacterium]ADU62411.1 lipoprotein releasing system, transmembrane protein, LolC/E family [Pseudodesulfovibrio aespoeensis Aspo-2]MBU4377792.1 lipoprotein-releasing ABC transporter permease subunit [Pseudomonadota bacterium]MBU4473924.1 lipoprotein-releasing ABC transporter permease subunit [Pseudomonadota bacterium]MBU45
MRFETFVALRYLFALRRQAFISVISLFAVFGVAIGVGALIVVIGVMNGFSTDLRNKILGVNAHILVTSLRGGIKDYRNLADEATQVPGVIGVTPFIYSEVILSTRSGVKGVVLRGIDPTTSDSVLSLSKDMISGGLANLDANVDKPGIIIGSELANRLGLAQGSEVNLLSPSGRAGSAGFTPKIRPFLVAGIFRTGMFEYDSSLGYVTIPAARQLLGFKEDVVSGLEISVNDVYNVEHISELLRERVGSFTVYVRHWQEMNANLFAALELEKTAMFIILAMIVLVGSFSIVTTLVMLVIQKTKDIAVLMSIGADVSSIRRIFMLQGTFIGLAGTVFGFLIGVPVSLLLKKYQFIKLPSNVYPVDYLPVRLEAIDLLSIGGAAFLLCFLATIYPARRAAALNPSDALRYE